ncbi:tetratricopeptide repeat protein [Cerasicoccus maritimus]|uniref:tetratricopeptide repeat protein n=1 Tax=Cerasicoccus maritimus TaxID=490089 RepID=UPI00285295A7|nr:tetratricopeptide repeat protein [Cerasicoccus maritimus]
MNRPPKKKKQRQDGLAEDPRFSREELERAAPHASKAEGDDRNIVEIDDAFAEADLEDRAWLYWQNNKGTIIAAIVIAILGVVGVNTWKMMQANQVANLQEDYSLAIGDAEKLQSFGAANSDTALGGIATLKAADDKYTAGEFETAIGLYQQSVPALKDTVIVGRARLGVGMSQIKAGQTDAGKATLTTLMDSAAILAAIRAEAALEVAQLELASGNRDAAQKILENVTEMENVTYWKRMAEALIRSEKLNVES